MPNPTKRLNSTPYSYGLPKVEISVEKKTTETAPATAAPHSNSEPEPQTEIREVTRVINQAELRRLPGDRQALIHKFSVCDQEGFLTVGLYDDGSPGEVFIRMNKTDSVTRGLLDALAMSISLA